MMLRGFVSLSKLSGKRVVNPTSFRKFADVKPADALKLTFAAPHSSFFKEQVVESVLVPGVSGDFCILVGHVPTIAQLRPGTVTVTPKEGTATSYFVSGGFAFVSEDSICNVNVPEAARLEDIDLDAAKETVRNYETQLGAAKNDEERAAASVALEVAQALVTSLTTK